MSSLKIGVASVTFRSKTVEQIVEICKKAQVGYIEWGADVHVKTADDARKVRALCDSANIKISSYGSYYRVGDSNHAEWKQLCENAYIMGASSIRVWLGQKDSEKTDAEEYRCILEDCRALCDIAGEYGITVSPECHDNTFNNNTDAILKFIKDLDCDNFRTYFQSRYFRMEYDLDRIDRTFDFIENVHVSYRDLKKEQMFRKKDSRYIDKLLEKLKDKGFDGIVMVEFVDSDSEEVFYKDVEKLRSH